jgi:hypothetical protein
VLQQKLQEAFQKGAEDARKRSSTSLFENAFASTEASIPQTPELLQQKLQEAFQKGVEDARKRSSTSLFENAFASTEASIAQNTSPPIQRQHSERHTVNRKRSRSTDRFER